MEASLRRSWAVAFAAKAIASIALLRCVAPAFAAIPPPDPKSSRASAEYQADESATQTPLASPIPEVVLGDLTNHINTSKRLKMGREVTVCVKGLYDWIYVQKKPAADLRLFIGGQILSGVAPSSLSPPGQEYVNFLLKIESPDSPDWKAWALIVDASRQSSKHKLSISIAEGTQVFKSEAVTTVPPYPDDWYYFLAAFVCLLVALIILAAKTTLLRYTVGAGSASSRKAPFSLGLVQMAFWFYLAVAAYVYLCVSTLQIHIPMGSVLGLLGISATTGLAAAAVDTRKNSTARTLSAEQTALNARITELSSVSLQPGSAAGQELLEREIRLAQVDALVAQLPAVGVSASSKGFFPDILSDGDGISFHRFQIMVWTIVLGCVFVWGVYFNMSMPEFDASLLTLMGISSGTYVGFKFPETPKT